MNGKKVPFVATAFFVLVVSIVVIGIMVQHPSETKSLAGNENEYPQRHQDTPSVIPDNDLNQIPALPAVARITEYDATARLREEYPESEYRIERVVLHDRLSPGVLYEFSLVPEANSIFHANATLFIDAGTGDFYHPAQESAGISIDDAKRLARQAFPAWDPDRVRIRFHDGSNHLRGWEFSLYKEGIRLVQGGLLPDTGELEWYAIGVTRSGRPESPAIALDAARTVAEQEIHSRNGNLPLKLTDSRLDPLGMATEKVAGNYVFVYNRLIQGYPCDRDGFTIVVDSVTGNVVEYRRTWRLKDDAVARQEKTPVSKDNAETLAIREAGAVFPASARTLRIVSSELRWRDHHNPDRQVVTPGSIVLAWKVQFDDDTIRAQQWPSPGTAWIDAQTGSLLDLSYRH